MLISPLQSFLSLKHSFSATVFSISPPPSSFNRLSVLDEANICALLAEALTADHETVFSDQTSRVCADSAMGYLVSSCSQYQRDRFVISLRPLDRTVEPRKSTLTIRESPFRRCAGASTRRTRETCWVVAVCDLRIRRTVWRVH
jgi:hypothetical protein